jgi:hypothetical protein
VPEYTIRAAHPERAAQQGAAKLLRGEQILDAGNHHKAMAYIKRPRPEGQQLSLINEMGPDTYWGRDHGKPYRLSINPVDYTWESPGENIRRIYVT